MVQPHRPRDDFRRKSISAIIRSFCHALIVAIRRQPDRTIRDSTIAETTSCMATLSSPMTSSSLARNARRSSARHRCIGSRSPRFSHSPLTVLSPPSLTPMRRVELTLTSEWCFPTHKKSRRKQSSLRSQRYQTSEIRSRFVTVAMVWWIRAYPALNAAHV